MKSNKASLGFIFATILIDVIGLGIIIPVIPSLIEKLSGQGLSEASKIGGWLMFSFAIMQFVFAPVLGVLSDKFGRRPVLLFALLGLGIDYLFHAFAPSIFWLFVGRVLAGISGASFTVASAYIADISTSENKAQNFGILGAAFGLGFIIGPVIGGVCSKWGVQVPFLVAAGLSFINLIYGFFVLPESLKEENKREIVWKNANPVKTLIRLNRYPVILSFVFVFFLVQLAGHSLQSTWTYFTMFQFNWDEATVGYSLAVVGVLVALVQGVLVKPTVKMFGEQNTVLLGMIFWLIGMILFSTASKSWMMFVYLVPYCLGGVAGATLQGIISNQVPANEQGELQGTLTSLISLTSIIGPPLMTGLFYYFTSDGAPIQLPGIPFITASILFLISLILIYKPLMKLSSVNKV